MNGLPYYKAYPRDFIEGTIGMDFETKAAYRLVLDLIYMQGGNLPDDARYISGLLGCSVKKWNLLRETLVDAGKIDVRGGTLWCKIIDEWAAMDRREQTRPAIPAPIREAVWQRDGECCAYCGTFAGPFHLDHIIPWSRGGDHSVENLTVACAPCNWSKRDKLICEWTRADQ